MRHIVHIDDKPVVLVYGDIDLTVDANSITLIDYSNIYGEAVTISCLLNRVGQLKAEAEKIFEEKKEERSYMEANLEKRWRMEASKGEGKFTVTDEFGVTGSMKLTDNSVKCAILSDAGYKICKNNEIKAKRDLAYLDSLYWAVQDKSKKLNNFLPQVTPQEFWNEIIDGSINGIMINKIKR